MIWRAELFWVSLTYLSIILANNDDNVQVNGLLYQYVELSSNLSHRYSVQEADWHFKRKGKLNKIAQFGNHQLRFYTSQFNGRLQVLDNGTTLHIKDLRMEDSGHYTAQFVIMEQEEDHSEHFTLMVYEPVPEPSIRIVMEKKSNQLCNVTLHCSVPTNSSPLTYSWINSHTDSVYEMSGEVVHLSVNDSWDMRYQCIVNNPADRNNVSRQARCNAADGAAVNRISYVIIISLLLMLILCLMIWIVTRKGSSKLTENNDQTQAITNSQHHHLSEREEEETGGEPIQQEDEMPYCEPSFSTNHPKSQTFSWHDRGNHVTPPPQKFKTLYVSLQRK